MKKLVLLLFMIGGLTIQAPAAMQPYTYITTEADRSNDTERYIDFHADIKIMTDGNVIITEYITLYAAGVDIKRGITRSIPEYRIDKNGKKKTIPVKVISLSRNGERSDYHTEASNGSSGRECVVYFGSGDVMLKKGIHQYEFVYETRGHVGFFEQFDELYWNVVGTSFDFTVEHASATLHTPGDSEAIKWSCYTGVSGSNEKACDCNGDKAMPTFKASRVLQPREGFAVAVAFPCGIITRPTVVESFKEQYWNWILGIIMLVALLVYMVISWVMVGRDPRKMTVIPLFSVPNGWSSEKVRYLYKHTFDKKAFTVALLQMAVKGAIMIECRMVKSFYLISKGTQGTAEYNSMNKDQQEAFNNLFGGFKLVKKIDGRDFYYDEPVKTEVEINASNSILFIAAMNSIKKAVTDLIPLKVFYKTNTGLVTVCMAVNTIFCLFYNIYMYDVDNGLAPFFIIPLIGIVMSVVYLRVIGARTEFGTKVQAELEGLKMYLGTAEKHRFNQLMPPEQTPRHFEEMLPYAVALDVGNEWCKKFHDVLKMYNYTPEWYGNDKSDSDFLSDILAVDFLSTIDKSVSIASTPPSSSSSGSSSWDSGSDGGGSSDGGGGGGGSSGW